MWNIIVVFLVAVCLVQADEQIMALAQTCIKQTLVDPAKVQNLSTNGNFSDDPKLKKFALCVNKAAGFQNAQGDIQRSNMKPFLDGKIKDANKVKEAMSKCLVKKNNPEETAAAMWKCLIPYIS